MVLNYWLTLCGLVTPNDVIDLAQHWIRKWLIASLVPSRYLNQCWSFFVIWTLKNKLDWKLNQNTIILIQENAFENVVTEMTAILFQPHYRVQNLLLIKYAARIVTVDQHLISVRFWRCSVWVWHLFDISHHWQVLRQIITYVTVSFGSLHPPSLATR